MLFIPWICLLSFIFLEAPCRHNFMNATQTPHAWAFSAVHPSIYRPVPPWFTMTARPPPASPRSLPCSSPLKCLHESEALARNVGKSSLPNPTSNDRISHGFSWGLKSSHFFVALLKTCRIGMCHWRLFFVFGGGSLLELTERYVVWTRMLTSSQKKHNFFEVPPCLQWFKVDMTDKSLTKTMYCFPLFLLVAFFVPIGVLCRDGGGQKL